jgi:hypothetical protein
MMPEKMPPTRNLCQVTYFLLADRLRGNWRPGQKDAGQALQGLKSLRENPVLRKGAGSPVPPLSTASAAEVHLFHPAKSLMRKLKDALSG